MIQELLGGGEERKISIIGGMVEASSSITSSSSSPSSSDQQTLRCPRCDSPNTKFCYYNNYNLTQPRHFCKTCRRYWTKGGTLRNVPIGGGCRKNKSVSVSVATTGKLVPSPGKSKPMSSEMGKSNLGNGFDHDVPAYNRIMWAPPQNSPLMALLRATPNPNPNPNANFVRAEDEGAMIGSHMVSDSPLMSSTLNARNLGLDSLGQIPIGPCGSLWRNNHIHQQQQQQEQQQQQQELQLQQHSMWMSEAPNSGLQELYQKLRSSSNYYTDHNSQVLLNNVASSSSSSSTLGPMSSIAGGELGYWNSPFSWSDLPTPNGAFP